MTSQLQNLSATLPPVGTLAVVPGTLDGIGAGGTGATALTGPPMPPTGGATVDGGGGGTAMPAATNAVDDARKVELLQQLVSVLTQLVAARQAQIGAASVAGGGGSVGGTVDPEALGAQVSGGQLGGQPSWSGAYTVSGGGGAAAAPAATDGAVDPEVLGAEVSGGGQLGGQPSWSGAYSVQDAAAGVTGGGGSVGSGQAVMGGATSLGGDYSRGWEILEATGAPVGTGAVMGANAVMQPTTATTVQPAAGQAAVLAPTTAPASTEASIGELLGAGAQPVAPDATTGAATTTAGGAAAAPAATPTIDMRRVVGTPQPGGVIDIAMRAAKPMAAEAHSEGAWTVLTDANGAQMQAHVHGPWSSHPDRIVEGIQRGYIAVHLHEDGTLHLHDVV